MRGNKRAGTAPEMRVRRLAHAAGLRYRVDARPLTEERFRADLVFAGPKLAVFIDGCYWHGCPEHYRPARTNAEFWRAKIAANKARDQRVDALLAASGWMVVRAWEHEDPVEIVDRVLAVVKRGRNGRDAVRCPATTSRALGDPPPRRAAQAGSLQDVPPHTGAASRRAPRSTP